MRFCCTDAQVRDSSGLTQALEAALRHADDRQYDSSDDEVQQRQQQRRDGELTCLSFSLVHENVDDLTCAFFQITLCIHPMPINQYLRSGGGHHTVLMVVNMVMMIQMMILM
jgi:hypothetical protein